MFSCNQFPTYQLILPSIYDELWPFTAYGAAPMHLATQGIHLMTYTASHQTVVAPLAAFTMACLLFV
jgi:hypothetical protein